MAYELIYTSVPQGLQMGSSGFCTAAMTNGMSPMLIQKLESLSGYKPCFSHTDQNYAKNPVSYFHYILRISGENLSLLGRVCSAGLDYTKRSNKLAHFLVADEKERVACPGGPSSFASANGAFVQSWSGQPQLYQSARVIAGRPYQPRVAAHWGAYSGDPGWAGWLAQSFLDDPKSIVFVIFDPLRHTNILELVDESLQLLPEEIRWKVTFNTYMSNLSADSICNWRFCTDDKETLRASGWMPKSVVLDLRGSLPSAGSGDLASQARTGNIPQPRKQIRVQVPFPAGISEKTDNALSLNDLRKKKAEEEERRQAEARYKESRRLIRESDDNSLSDAEISAWHYNEILRSQSYSRKLNTTITILIFIFIFNFALQGIFYWYDYRPVKEKLLLGAQNLVSADSTASQKTTVATAATSPKEERKTQNPKDAVPTASPDGKLNQTSDNNRNKNVVSGAPQGSSSAGGKADIQEPGQSAVSVSALDTGHSSLTDNDGHLNSNRVNRSPPPQSASPNIEEANLSKLKSQAENTTEHGENITDGQKMQTAGNQLLTSDPAKTGDDALKKALPSGSMEEMVEKTAP